MLINNKKYKYKFRLKYVFSDFIKISHFFIKKIDTNWWFLNASRLDLRQAGDIDIIKNSKNHDKKSFNFILKFKNQLNILTFFIFNIFIKKKNLNINKNYLLAEQIDSQNNNLNTIDYYFKNIFNKNDVNLISVGLNYDKKNTNEIAIIKLCNSLDIIICYFDSIKVNLKYKIAKLQIENLDLLEKNFWKYYFRQKETSNNFKRLFLSKLVLRIFKKKWNYNLNIFYPYEEKPFERALNFATNTSSNNSVFAYYGNPQDHHSFFLRKFKKLNIPRPFNFLCAGSYQEEQLKKYNFKKKIMIIGSSKSEKEIKKNIKYDFLVFISHEIEFETFTNWIKDNEKSYENLRFLIRLYSQINNFKKNENFKYFEKKKNFFFSNQNFEGDISVSKFSIFSRTSAGPQAVNYGCLSIWADFSLVGSNALFNNLENFFPSFDKQSFHSNILKLSKMNKNEEINFLQSQKNISKKIFSNIDYKLIDNLIKAK